MRFWNEPLGRRTIFAMVLIVAVVVIWALLGGRLVAWSGERGFKEPAPAGGAEGWGRRDASMPRNRFGTSAW
jgi:hypothetical protein